jgi:serine/threonine protein kinase/WD40 repeat protein
LLLEFKNRRRAGESLTAHQFLTQLAAPADSELIVDLAFAEYLDAPPSGDTHLCDRLCAQFPEQAAEIRRQISFHEALARTSGELSDYASGHEPVGERHITHLENAGGLDTRADLTSDQLWTQPKIPGFKILKPLGRGGMGIVYLAHQPRLNRQVAVKLLLAGAFASNAHRARFRAEAQAAASLRHPNIVQIDEVGEAEGQPYLVMEFVEGGTLESYLKDHRPTPREAAEFVLSMARALHQAHLRGIIHRDLKPGNVMLSARPATQAGRNITTGTSLSDYVPKVTDFGMAKIVSNAESEPAGPTLTIAGDLLGTPSYMAPEQARGGTIGCWSDVYSLGAILYQLLTGRPPFLGPSAWETLEQVLNDAPPALPRTIPVHLRTICLTCLNKEPISRYSSMDHVADDLERYLAGKPIAARQRSAWAQASSWCQRNKVVATLGTTVSLALAETEITRQGEAVAHRKSLANLWDAMISQARAQQSTGRVGQRVQSLESVHQAQGLLDQVGATPERLTALRDTAAAGLLLDDFRKVGDWKGTNVPNDYAAATDRTWNRVAQLIDDHTILVTDDLGSKPVARLPSFGAQRLALSADGRWLAGWAGDCRIVDLQSPSSTPIATFASGGCWSFSNDARWLVGGDRESAVIVDLASNTVRHRVRAPSPTHLPAFTDDDRRVALLAENSLVIVDVKTGVVLSKLNAPEQPHGIRCLAWHPNNRHLAVYGYRNDMIAVWDTSTNKIHRRFNQPGSAVSIAFDRSGQNLITSSTWLGEVNVFDLESETLRLSTRALCVCMASDPTAGVRMMFSSPTNSNEVWEIQSQQVIKPFDSVRGPQVQRFTGAQSPDGRWTAVTTTRGIEIYDNATQSMVAELPIGPIMFNRVAIDSRQRLWACMDDGWLRWQFEDEGLSQPEKLTASASFFPIDIDPSGTWSLTSNDRHVKLESLDEPHREIDLGETLDVRNVAFSADGQLVATAEWNGAGTKVWNMSDGKLVAELATGSFCEVLFSPDGNVLFTSPDGGELWDTHSWNKVHRAGFNLHLIHHLGELRVIFDGHEPTFAVTCIVRQCNNWLVPSRTHCILGIFGNILWAVAEVLL